MPDPTNLEQAFEEYRLAVVAALTDNASDALVSGEVRATKLMMIPLDFNLINSRAVLATEYYKKQLIEFGGSEVTRIGADGVASRVFEPWLETAIRADKEQISAIIKDAIETGRPLRQVEKALADVSAMREHNSKLTAYQETKALFNKGTFDRFNDLQIKRGIWHHMDPQLHPRVEHQALDGQEFDLTDPVWNLQNEYHCKCWCEPVIKVHAFGNVEDPDVKWITVRGLHIPIRKGETADMAIQRAIDFREPSGGSTKAKPDTSTPSKKSPKTTSKKSPDTSKSSKTTSGNESDKTLVKSMNKSTNKKTGKKIAEDQEKNLSKNLEYTKSDTIQNNKELGDYTSSGYVDINKNLRKGDLKTNSKTIKEMDMLISKSPSLPEGTVLYRGIGESGVASTMNMKPGDVCNDGAYQSFSTNPHVSSNFSGSAQVEGTTGKQKVIFRAVTSGSQKGLVVGGSEHEVIMPRGSGWKVVSNTAVTTGVNVGRVTTHVITVVPA